MTPEVRTYPGAVYQDESSFLAAMRRAKWMLFAVVCVTTAVCLKDALADSGPDGWIGSLKHHSLKIVLTVSICWCAFRGGKVSGLYIAAGYFFSLFGQGIGMGLAVGFYLGLRPSLQAAFGELAGSALSFAVTAVWCVFSFWVLEGSADVRLYREVRRLGLTPTEAFVRRGRPFGQRPQPSIHAS